jgi:hypothetical protein
MKETYTLPQIPKPANIYFNIEDFDYNMDSLQAIDLGGENLFPRSKVKISRKSVGLYQAIEPALLLASQIILQFPQTYAMMIARRTSKEDYVTKEDITFTTSDDTRHMIRSMNPDLNIDPDMSERSEEYAMTYLHSSQESDLVRLNSKLLTVVLSSSASILSKRMTLFSIAFLMCHQLVHILEFTSIRKNQ